MKLWQGKKKRKKERSKGKERWKKKERKKLGKGRERKWGSESENKKEMKEKKVDERVEEEEEDDASLWVGGRKEGREEGWKIQSTSNTHQTSEHQNCQLEWKVWSFIYFNDWTEYVYDGHMDSDLTLNTTGSGPTRSCKNKQFSHHQGNQGARLYTAGKETLKTCLGFRALKRLWHSEEAACDHLICPFLSLKFMRGKTNPGLEWTTTGKR